MKNEIFAEYSKEEKIQFLEEGNDGISRERYKRKFQGNERAKLRQRNAEIDLLLGEIDEELAERKAEIKQRRDPLAAEKKKILEDLKQGGVFVEGRLFKIVDRENHEVGFYDEDGMLVEQRGMTPAERQMYIHFND